MGLALQHGSGIRFRPEGQPACKAWRLILPLCLRSEDSTYTRRRARYAQYSPARDEQSYSVFPRLHTQQQPVEDPLSSTLNVQVMEILDAARESARTGRAVELR